MKLITKIQITFFVVILAVAIQSIMVYTNVDSIGNEIEEISEYQVPTNTLVMELEKDILEEEILTYQLLLYSKDVHSKEFTDVEHHLSKIEKETDKKFNKVFGVLKSAIEYSHEADVKGKYNEILTTFKHLRDEQKMFESLVEKLEHNLTNSKHDYTTIHMKKTEPLLNRMEKEIVKISSIIEHLLEKSTHNALKDEHSVITIIISSILLLIIFMNISGYFLARVFKKALNTMHNHIHYVTDSQDLTKTLDASSNDEMGMMAKTLMS